MEKKNKKHKKSCLPVDRLPSLHHADQPGEKQEKEIFFVCQKRREKSKKIDVRPAYPFNFFLFDIILLFFFFFFFVCFGFSFPPSAFGSKQKINKKFCLYFCLYRNSSFYRIFFFGKTFQFLSIHLLCEKKKQTKKGKCFQLSS